MKKLRHRELQVLAQGPWLGSSSIKTVSRPVIQTTLNTLIRRRLGGRRAMRTFVLTPSTALWPQLPLIIQSSVGRQSTGNRLITKSLSWVSVLISLDSMAVCTMVHPIKGYPLFLWLSDFDLRLSGNALGSILSPPLPASSLPNPMHLRSFTYWGWVPVFTSFPPSILICLMDISMCIPFYLPAPLTQNLCSHRLF